MPKRKYCCLNLNSQLLGCVIAPFCTITDLSSLSCVCKELQCSFQVPLTVRNEWSLADIQNWPASRCNLVKRLLYVRQFKLISWPVKLEHLTIDSSMFNFSFTLPPLPFTLTHLSLSKLYDPENSIELLKNLKSLTAGRGFNRTMGQLPDGLLRLELGDDFDQPLGLLPSNLLELCIGNSFDQPLGILPCALKKLSIGNNYGQPLGNLPSTLTDLKIHYVSITHPLSQFPRGLLHLEVFWHRPILGILPLGLTHLSLHIYKWPLGILPEGLQELTIGNSYDYAGTTVPAGLTKLQFGKDFHRWTRSEAKSTPFVGKW